MPRPTRQRPPPTSRPPQRETPASKPDQLSVLEGEHRNFQRLLSLFESQLALFRRGEDPDYTLMRDISTRTGSITRTRTWSSTGCSRSSRPPAPSFSSC